MYTIDKSKMHNYIERLRHTSWPQMKTFAN